MLRLIKAVLRKVFFPERLNVAIATPLAIEDPALATSREAYALDQNKVILSVKRYHEENFDQVSNAVELAENQLRKFIAKPNSLDPAKALANEITLTRFYTLILGVWCEARLHKLLYETGAFDEADRSVVYNIKAIEHRWQAALEIGIRKHASLNPMDEINGQTLSFSKFMIYEEIRNWILIYFSPAITLRNKIAHAQWTKPFGNMQGQWINSSDFRINQNSMDALRNENLLTITLKFNLIKEVSTTINNLAVDSAIFQTTDFDVRHKIVSGVVSKLNNADYAKYRASIAGKYGT
ncbi:hypothetical protein GIW70_12030 [Pseudomonas syringae]|nr:hypothetical protein [Pseudomonas syringae]MCF5068913.1 hypothetical protein [Pseudomonas syringae]